MYKALFISEIPASQNLIHAACDFRITECTSFTCAEDYLDAEQFSIIIVFSENPDSSVFEFFSTAYTQTNSLLLLVSQKLPDAQRSSFLSKGIFLFSSETELQGFFHFIPLILHNEDRYLNFTKFSTSQKKAYELKILARAKYILMTNLKMTESEAHKFIEQQSMNLCQSRTATAESILKTYEN